MAITSRDQLIAAQITGQRVRIIKTAIRTVVSTFHFSVIDVVGTPTGVLAGTNTAAGLVPDDSTAGVPVINAFTGANKGYLSRVECNSSAASRVAIYDMLFKAGAYAFNSSVTLASQPSYSTRVPGGTDYKGTELWLETVTAFTGNQTIQVTYQNHLNAAGDTGTIATGVAPTVGRMLRLPLATGDLGVQRVNSVVATNASAGTFNVLVMRKLWEGRIRVNNDSITHGPDLTGLPEMYADSALVLVVTGDSTSSGLIDLVADVING